MLRYFFWIFPFYSRFTNHNLHNTVPYYTQNKITVRVVDIYDGDTIKVVSDHINKSFYTFSIRLYGIDACEITSKNEKIQNLAVRARNRLFNLVTDFSQVDENISRLEFQKILNDKVYTVDLVCYNFDKYGRILSEIHNKYGCLNYILVKEKLALLYNGKRRTSDEEMLRLLI